MKTKRVIISLMVLCCAMAVKAQNDVAIATLQHGNNVSVFKGPSALASALAAASEQGGDVITLSQGTFNASPVSKPVSIYGAGFEEDATAGTFKTIISGSLDIGIANATCSGIHLEGLYLNNDVYLGTTDYESNTILTDLTVVKTYVRNQIMINANTDNIFFDQCILANGFFSSPSTGINYKASNLYLKNCYLYGSLRNFQFSDNYITLENCIFNTSANGNIFKDTNCPITMIASIYMNNYGAFPPAGSDLRYCLGNQGEIITKSKNPGYETCYCTEDSPWTGVFTDGDNATYSPTRTYELQQPTVWVDANGKEIGIRGGNGWSRIPSTPAVKNLQLGVNGSSLNVTYDAETRN